MKEIVHVTPLEDFRLEVEFSDGQRRTIDVKPYIRGPLFESLRDEDLFRAVRVEEYFGGLSWPNGAELSPTVVYEESVPVPREATV